MSTLLMHNIEPFFCSAQNTAHTNDEDHLSFQTVSNVGFPESLNFAIDTSMNNGGNGGHGNDQSPLNYHHNLYQNGINGNYHHLLTHNNANSNHHYHLVVDGNNHQLLDNQLLHNYSTNGCFSTANNNNNDMKSEFLLDEYNNNNTNVNNNHEQTVSCIPCILDEYPAQIEASSTSSSSQSWLIKSPEQWLSSEVAQWIRNWAQRNEIQDIEVAHLLYNRMSGLELCQMQREYFTTVCPQYGDLIYDSLQSLLQQFRCSSSSSQIQHPTINSNSPTTTISAPVTCFTLSPAVATSANTFPDNNSNTTNAAQMNHCMEENCGGRESDSSTNNENLLTSNEHHHHHHHHLLPMVDIYCNNNNVDLLSTVSAVANIFDGSSPPPQTPTITHNTNQTHQHLEQHSPSYSNAFDSDDRESTSSTYSSNDPQHQKISLNSTTYYSSPQSTTSSILNNNTNHLHQHLHHHHDNIHVAFNNNNDNLSAMKQHRSNNNINANNLNNNGRRGRPPKKENKSRSKGNGKLWEFIRDLLLNPITNPSLIRWERREDGIFKFIQSDKVAKMWGERKQNPRMTYEKLSRAMRYYYKSQVLLPVFGRRLVYKFGPNATGWRPTPMTTSSIHHHDNNDNNNKINFSATTIIEINQN